MQTASELRASIKQSIPFDFWVRKVGPVFYIGLPQFALSTIPASSRIAQLLAAAELHARLAYRLMLAIAIAAAGLALFPL